jgi:hypothetical protein
VVEPLVGWLVLAIAGQDRPGFFSFSDNIDTVHMLIGITSVWTLQRCSWSYARGSGDTHHYLSSPVVKDGVLSCCHAETTGRLIQNRLHPSVSPAAFPPSSRRGPYHRRVSRRCRQLTALRARLRCLASPQPREPAPQSDNQLPQTVRRPVPPSRQ